MAPTAVFLTSSFAEFDGIRKRIGERLHPFRREFSLVDLDDALSHHASPLVRSLRAVDACDVVVVLLGDRYGEKVNDAGRPDASGRSIVHREVERAISQKKAILPFLVGHSWSSRLANPDRSLLVQLAQLCRQATTPIVAGDKDDPAVVSKLGDVIVSSLFGRRYWAEVEDVRIENLDDFGRGTVEDYLGFRLPVTQALLTEEDAEPTSQTRAAAFDAKTAMTLLDAGLLDEAGDFLDRAVAQHPTHAPRALTLAAISVVCGAVAAAPAEQTKQLAAALRYARLAERVEALRAEGRSMGTSGTHASERAHDRQVRMSASALLDALASRMTAARAPDESESQRWAARAAASAERATRFAEWYWPAKLEAARSYRALADILRRRAGPTDEAEAQRLEREAREFLLGVFWLRAEAWPGISADEGLARITAHAEAHCRHEFRLQHEALRSMEQAVGSPRQPVSASYYQDDVMRSVYSLRSRSRHLIQDLRALARSLVELGAHRPARLEALSYSDAERVRLDANMHVFSRDMENARRSAKRWQGAIIASGVTVVASLVTSTGAAYIAFGGRRRGAVCLAVARGESGRAPLGEVPRRGAGET